MKCTITQKTLTPPTQGGSLNESPLVFMEPELATTELRSAKLNSGIILQTSLPPMLSILSFMSGSSDIMAYKNDLLNVL